MAGKTLRKLPLWGERVSEDEINFEWPTPEIFAQMQPDVTIQSIEFKTYSQSSTAVSSVKVILSNGESSPVFEKSGYKTNH